MLGDFAEFRCTNTIDFVRKASDCIHEGYISGTFAFAEGMITVLCVRGSLVAFTKG